MPSFLPSFLSLFLSSKCTLGTQDAEMRCLAYSSCRSSYRTCGHQTSTFFFHYLSRIGLYVKGIRVLPDFSVTFFVQSSEFQERDRAGIGAERALQGRGVARETSSYPTHLSWLESFPRLLLLLLLAVVVVFVAIVIFVLRSYPPTFF
jgi:hypothetical protein